jgi:uncharacterized membrane protein YdbT with pleckstrin-like domain
MAEPQEELIWRGPSSHVRHFWLYVACWAFCWLVVPFFIWLWRWLELRNRVYELTTERLKITQGIFAKRSDDLELYRVRDTSLNQPFLYRLFNRADLVLNTTDTTTPVVVLECVPAPYALRDKLRAAVETCRDRKRARVAELTGPLDVDTDGTPMA